MATVQWIGGNCASDGNGRSRSFVSLPDVFPDSPGFFSGGCLREMPGISETLHMPYFLVLFAILRLLLYPMTESRLARNPQVRNRGRRWTEKNDQVANFFSLAKQQM